MKPEKSKPAQALLKQNTESIKTAAQTNEVPKEVVTTPIEPATPIIEPIPDKIPEPQPIISVTTASITPSSNTTTVNVIASAPIIDTSPKVLQPSNQFIQIKPPTTTGRIQSPAMKNFFIRKGIEKQPAPTILTASGAMTPIITSSQLTGNKKIIIKSQQIIVPATKQSQPTIQPNASLTVMNTVDSIVTSPSDLSGILDLPILFADNETIIDQNDTPSTTQIVSLPNDVPSANILITSPEGKLPNRPVVISAAKIGRTMTVAPSTTNKVIFINRNQIKPQIVTSQTVSPAPMVKGMPTIKLVPTSLSNQPITFTNNLGKLAPGTKIDLSQLKIVKNVSPNVQGGLNKPIIINKPTVIGTQPGTKNAILIKSTTPNIQAHQIKGNILNRNITVRKVMNVQSPKTISPVVSKASTTVTTTDLTASPTVQASPKFLRKPKPSN